MFDQPSARLHQALLEARERRLLDPLGQQQSPPQIAETIGKDGEDLGAWGSVAFSASVLSLMRANQPLMGVFYGEF